MVRRLLTFSIAVLFAGSAVAQAHFSECLSQTGTNATIVIQQAKAPQIGERALEPGDEIAVFTRAGRCVGVVTWQSESAAMAAWGFDETSGATDGLLPGDEMHFRAWSSSDEVEYSSANSTVVATFETGKPYLQPDARYVDDGIYVLDWLSFTELQKQATSALAPGSE